MLFLIFFSIFFGSARSEARIYDLYRADRRFKGAFCTAIGGACAADNDIITAIFENPAALATGVADWDFDGDYASKSNLEPGMQDSVDRSESSGVLGISFSRGNFGAGAAFALQTDDVNSNLTLFDDEGLPKTVPIHNHSRTLQFRLPVGFQLTPQWSCGMSFSLSHQTQEITLAGANEPTQQAASGYGFGLSFGLLYAPGPRLRLGTWFRLPATMFESFQLSATSLATTVNYREDLAMHNPWIWAVGSQLAVGDADLLFAELDLIGATGNAYLFSYDTLSAAESDSALKGKGRAVTLEPHAGYRLPLGAKVRLHLGSYFEPPRVDGVSGRLHGTGGISFEAFHLAEIIGGLDFASRYQQIIFTFR